MRTPTATAQWRTSSWSGGNGNCVEVGMFADAVMIRDTKHRDGGTIVIDHTTFAAFLAHIRRTR